MRRIVSGLTLIALSACAAPDFSMTAAAPEAGEACPDWRAAHLSHAIDPLHARLHDRRAPFRAETAPLGCSVNAALRAQVARPSDLVAPPRRMTPAAGVGAQRTLESFRQNGPKELRDSDFKAGGE